MNIDPHIFRAYDIRGVVETALKPEVVALIGQALGSLYPNSKTVVVARDGRMSSKQLVDSLSQGLKDSGCKVIDIGQVPTPVLYYATHKLGTGAGVMVTGSHNPPEYNGLKMVMDGKTLYGEDIQAIHQCIIKNELKSEAGSIKEEDQTLLKEATIYISLEPCCIHANTPPCTDLIIKHKVPHVVIGCIDDNPEVAGKGIEKLKENF